MRHKGYQEQIEDLAAYTRSLDETKLSLREKIGISVILVAFIWLVKE